jgi:hypothetical protein
LERGIEIEVVWFDQDVTEVLIRCSNGRFSGQTKMYLSHDELSKTAGALRGFPSDSTDRRDFELGAFSASEAGGGVRMHFFCLDSVGHAVVEVALRSEGSEALGEAESVVLKLPVEAAAIDSFAVQARGLDTQELGSRARLQTSG